MIFVVCNDLIESEFGEPLDPATGQYGSRPKDEFRLSSLYPPPPPPPAKPNMPATGATPDNANPVIHSSTAPGRRANKHDLLDFEDDAEWEKMGRRVLPGARKGGNSDDEMGMEGLDDLEGGVGEEIDKEEIFGESTGWCLFGRVRGGRDGTAPACEAHTEHRYGR